jgi:hypothetical protein
MFLDVRLGNGGKIPDATKVPELYRLSKERCLYLRLTSPHEAKETLGGQPGKRSATNFLEKTEEKIELNTPQFGGRWNFAGALQPYAKNYMPDVVSTCKAFVGYFQPERTRIVFLSPDRHGTCLQDSKQLQLAERLGRIESVEVGWIDARERTTNGLFLADFFDFT